MGNCDSGYSCAYTNSISWRGPQTPMPPETNPRIAFERLFGDADFNATPEERAVGAAQRKSILDVVNGRTQRLLRDLGASDRRKLDEYLTGIREIERRIEMAEKDERAFTPDMEKPAGIPVSFAEYVKIMFDLQVLAFQADLTRVSTLVFGREGSVRTYNEIGVQRSASSAVASSQPAGESREAYEDQHVSRGPVRLLPGSPEEDERRRRHAAGPLDDRVRQRDLRRQQPLAHQPAGAPGRTRRGQIQAGPAHRVSRRARR